MEKSLSVQFVKDLGEDIYEPFELEKDKSYDVLLIRIAQHPKFDNIILQTYVVKEVTDA